MKKIFIIIFLLISSAIILLDYSDARGRGNNACKNDIEKFCSDKKGDKRAMIQCLEDNYNNLSNSCRELIDNRNG